MFWKRSVGLLLILAGMGSCFLAIETESQAVECNPPPAYFPAICAPAHEVPPTSYFFIGDPATSCVTSWYFWCVPIEDIMCTFEAYGEPVGGYCNFIYSEATLRHCVDNYFPRTITLHVHRTGCRFFEGSCQCVWILDDAGTQTVEVCDCTNI